MKLMKLLNKINKKIAVMAMLIITGTAAHGIEIIPSTFTYRLNPLGNTQDVTFFNRKDKPERVKVSFKPYRTDPESKYLGQWGTIYPKVITIPPKGQKTLKFSLETPSGLPKGEYRALLYMEELEQKALSPEGKVVVREGITSSQVNMLINLGVVVYGYSGNPDDLKVSGRVINEKVRNDDVSFTLENTGEISVPFKLVLEGTRKKDGSPKIEEINIMVVQGYSEKVVKDFPEDMKVNKIYVKDLKNNVIKTLK